MFKVDGWNNFCRIFELPEKFSSEYCFSSGVATNFQMVDWFNPITGLPNPAVSKEVWIKEVGEIQVTEVTVEQLKNDLSNFILGKGYVKKGRKYLFVANFGATFLMEEGVDNV